MTSETQTIGQTSTVINYTYDANGNLIKKKEGTKSTTYAFDVWGNMISADGASYTYNAQGLRTSKTVNKKKTSFNLINGKVWSDGTYNYVWGAELITNGSVYYLYNAHGDVVQLLNSSGVVTKTYDYEAYGNELTRDAADTNPFRYCGEYYDNETGFIYLRARYYNPSTGRFISQDPAKDGLNWYAYCNNNPVVLVDRNGLWPSWSQIFTAAAIVVTAAAVVAATVATAGAAGAAIGISAGMAAGGSAAVAGAATTIATGCIYGVAGYVGATAVSDTIEVFSGYNPIRDSIFRGNGELYATTEVLAYGAAAMFTEIGSQNWALGSTNSPDGTRTFTNSEVKKYAHASTKGPKNADSVVLGKWEGDSPTSYDYVAQREGAQYYNLDNWNELSKHYSRSELWRINQRFLDMQIKSGKQILFSHNPNDYLNNNSFFGDEVQYLYNLGYKFGKRGDMWYAYK